MALSERAKHATTDPNPQLRKRQILAFLADGHSHTRYEVQEAVYGRAYGAIQTIQYLHDLVDLGWVEKFRQGNTAFYFLTELGRVHLEGAEAFMGEAS
jgi:DNA-binding PadR family transcriptional regulator